MAPRYNSILFVLVTAIILSHASLCHAVQPVPQAQHPSNERPAVTTLVELWCLTAGRTPSLYSSGASRPSRTL